MLRILGNHLLGRHKATAHGSFPGPPPRPPSPTGKGRPRPRELLAVPGGLRTVQGWGNVLCFGGRDAHDYVCLLSSQMSSSSCIPSGTGSASAVSTWRAALRLGPQSGMFPSSNHSPPRTSQSTSPPTPQPTAQRARVPPPRCLFFPSPLAPCAVTGWGSSVARGAAFTDTPSSRRGDKKLYAARALGLLPILSLKTFGARFLLP